MSTTRPAEPPYRVLLHESGRYPVMNGARRHPWYRRTVMTVEIVTTVLSATAVLVGFWRMMVKMEDRLGSRIDRVEARFGQRIDRLDQQIDAVLAGRPA